MRIGDWSADVCSSDLAGSMLRPASYRPPGGCGSICRSSAQEMPDEPVPRGTAGGGEVLDIGIEMPAAQQRQQIGRASGRARGCQYGWTSVVAVSLNKTEEELTVACVNNY